MSNEQTADLFAMAKDLVQKMQDRRSHFDEVEGAISCLEKGEGAPRIIGGFGFGYADISPTDALGFFKIERERCLPQCQSDSMRIMRFLEAIL